jgi:hypothetical protein
MRPKPDSYQWYKMQKDTTQKAKEEIAKIREKLGVEGNRYERSQRPTGSDHK